MNTSLFPIIIVQFSSKIIKVLQDVLKQHSTLKYSHKMRYLSSRRHRTLVRIEILCDLQLNVKLIIQVIQTNETESPNKSCTENRNYCSTGQQSANIKKHNHKLTNLYSLPTSHKHLYIL